MCQQSALAKCKSNDGMHADANGLAETSFDGLAAHRFSTIMRHGARRLWAIQQVTSIGCRLPHVHQDCGAQVLRACHLHQGQLMGAPETGDIRTCRPLYRRSSAIIPGRILGWCQKRRACRLTCKVGGMQAGCVHERASS
jgi:hypothetical protein